MFNLFGKKNSQQEFTSAAQYLHAGVEAKRAGNLKEAEHLYVEAIKLEPDNLMCYYSLAKTQYLLNKKDASLANFLISAHISLQAVAQQLATNDLQAHILRERIKQFPPDMELVKIVVHPMAPFVFLDYWYSYHIGHVLVDFDAKLTSDAGIKNNASVYRRSLSTGIEVDKSSEEYQKEVMNYSLVGHWFVVDNLKWNEFSSDEPYRLYMTSSNFDCKSAQLILD